MRARFCLCFLLLCAVAHTLAPWGGHAQTLDSEFKDWAVFSLQQDGQKVCYMTSATTRESGNYKRRGKPYLLVTYRGREIAEVSVSSGYPYKTGSKVTLKVDGRTNFQLFTTDETPKIAWAKDSAEDASIIQRFIKGNRVTAKGYSKLGTYSLDTYSLLGFTKAYNRMKTLCKG